MDLRESIINQNDVARRLTKQLVQTEGKQSNLVLIAAGSKGPTQEQLLSFLNSKSTDHLNSFASQLESVIFSDGSPVGGPKLAFANGVWVQKDLPLKPSFKQVVDAYYKAALALVDFQTNVSSTRLIFTNALYFKGAWTEKFDASATKEQDFHLLDGSAVKAPFMTNKNKQYKLYVSSIFHKSFIEVNEEGTEAAAASAGVISNRRMPMTFVADRPFLFTISEETTGTVLFIGNLLNPLAG
ncbi:serpin-ZX-like [Pyrus ussuriensis x Pyrus communis]|uniref:Serpin-ZX-like n=1 Tax=Pyrus ussuriensis x Pyrus communis TaxID=2448454 RepID=A0A5N5HXA1_9ROSA|nr:serpin-ZX-like [Pyrus ussuriensis x Pyrus communis]